MVPFGSGEAKCDGLQLLVAIFDQFGERGPFGSGGIPGGVFSLTREGLSAGEASAVIAMHSLINCEGSDIARTVAALARRTNRAVAFTIAPRKAALTIMHAVGRLFPRGDRAPAIETILRAAL